MYGLASRFKSELDPGFSHQGVGGECGGWVGRASDTKTKPDWMAHVWNHREDLKA